MKHDSSEAPERLPAGLPASSGAQLAREAQERGWPPPLPARSARYQAVYEDQVAGLVSDLGGAAALSTQERMLVVSAAFKYVQMLRCWRNSLTRGLTRRDGQQRDVVLTGMALSNSLRHDLVVLGLRKRARDVESLGSYLSRRQSAPQPGAGDGNSDGSNPDSTPETERPAEAKAQLHPAAGDAEGRHGSGPRGGGA